MPRYFYRCEACSNEFLVMHGSEEVLEKCQLCSEENGLNKLLTRPMVDVKKTQSRGKVGKITEEFIEQSRTDLKMQRNELEKKR